ncbi:MAG: hypothetical protein ACOZCO_10625 [Bacteroidota bacterium]
METQKTNDSGSQLFLTGTILFANLDYSGLLDYALKAIIGGAIWMGFKMAGDYLNKKKKGK